MVKFKFEPRQQVMITISGEEGIIKGRAEYVDSKNQYHVHYKSATGTAMDAWFFESELKAVVVTPKPKRATTKKAAAKKTAGRRRKAIPPMPTPSSAK